VGEFYDASVSGADPIETRPGFTALLTYIAGNGARHVIVETASRFARDLMVIGGRPRATAGPRRHASRGRQPTLVRRRHADLEAGA
jgi:Resolvase, N terminal domain